MVHGFVILDDNVIGTFELDTDEKISITFQSTFKSVTEMLEVSAEQGMSFGMMANAEFHDYLPKHNQEIY